MSLFMSIFPDDSNGTTMKISRMRSQLSRMRSHVNEELDVMCTNRLDKISHVTFL